ncbi:MAG TPA: sigma-70 family RNA polymerase sigma factor [Blastocatellia bacterium]|nr:sigma-70 family RNA polymerase sigma factor [Blastocatellia bacterium]
MLDSPPNSVTKLLIKWRSGDEAALNELMPLVYNEMRRLAHQYMRRERSDHTLQTTALLNEAYLRLIDHKNINWQNRAHFMAVAAQAMRRVLVDYAVSRKSIKRGGNCQRVDLDEAMGVALQRAEELIGLDEALKRLAAMDQRKAHVVELRYFGGLTVEEIAEFFGIASITVMREWGAAKAWLLRELSKSDVEENDGPA